MSSTIEFNGKKYDSLTGKVLSSASGNRSGQIDVKEVLRPAFRSVDGISHGKKIEIKSESEAKKSIESPKQSQQRQGLHHRQVEKPKTLMRSVVKRPKHKPVSENSPPPRVGLNHEVTRERARRAKHIQKSASVAKFSKTAPRHRADITFTAQPLPVAVPPAPLREVVEEDSIVAQAEQFADRLEDAVQSAEAHLEAYAGNKLKTRKSRKFAYAFASFASVLLIGFAVYQAIPFVQVKMAGNKAGFAATLPAYAPQGYGLNNNLETGSGVVAMTFSSEAENKNYKITQTPSKWNSDSLLNNFVLPASDQYERIDQNGQTVYLYNSEKSATWLDSGIWYRLDGADSFSNDQLLRIVQGL